MVRGLSNKIVIFILVLLALAGGGGYSVYEYLIPAREQSESELAGLKAQIQAKYEEVAKMKEEFVLLQSQLRDFKDLEARGFFNNQNRSEAEENFAKLNARVGILKATLTYQPGAIVNNKQADAAKQMVIKSQGKVEIESLDDVDVYTLLKFMQERYPGSIDITKLELERVQVLNAALLRKIGGGDPVPLIKGEFEFDWRTMTSKDDANPPGGN